MSSEERYHKMVEEVEDYAILLLDPQGYILNWNKGAERIKGYSEAEIVGKNFRIFYLEEDRKSKLPELLIQRAIHAGKAMNEGWRLRKDGTKFWGNIVITALHDDQKEVIGFSKVTRDLTERKLAEDNLKNYAGELELQNRQLEEYAYVASHDLQEPLRTISNFVGLFQKQYAGILDERALQYLAYTTQAADRMRSLIVRLLEYSRLGTNKELCQVDTQLVVQEVLADLAASITEAGAEITAGDLPVINGYHTEIKQLFQNLVINAIKFRKKDITPQIKIAAVKGIGHWEFTISDNGIGIAHQHREKIFSIFQRLHSRKEYEGSGIGLSNCKKIVEIHNGKIWVQSTPGTGSTFHFTIKTI